MLLLLLLCLLLHLLLVLLGDSIVEIRSSCVHVPIVDEAGVSGGGGTFRWLCRTSGRDGIPGRIRLLMLFFSSRSVGRGGE